MEKEKSTRGHNPQLPPRNKSKTHSSLQQNVLGRSTIGHWYFKEIGLSFCVCVCGGGGYSRVFQNT